MITIHDQVSTTRDAGHNSYHPNHRWPASLESLLHDSKHALKTLRNNLFSGARLLVPGNYTIIYATIRDPFANDSPLYRRDVEKLDRQERLFSTSTLSFLASHYPRTCGGDCLSPRIRRLDQCVSKLVNTSS